jgi:hypothetical protein
MPDKKFFDIYPPSKVTSGKDKSSQPTEEKIAQSVYKKRDIFSLKKFFIALIFLSLVGVIAFGYLHFTKVEVKIWPKTQFLSFHEKITADIKFNQNNPAFSIEKRMIPARLVEEERSESQQFVSTGKFLKEVKAKGQIRVYNNYSTAPQILVAGTRFISSEGKLFKSLAKVTIPGAKYDSKGKLQSSYIDVEVEASEAGEDYNIAPSTFSIPGFVGTAKYTAFYGKSFSPMAGGFRGEVSQVTQGDLDRARETLATKILQDSRSSISNKIDNDFILLNEAIKEEVFEASSLLPAGAQADSFNYQVKIKIKALVFKKSDLENFARDFILISTTEGKVIDEKSLKVEYNQRAVDFDSGEIELDSNFSANVYQRINEREIKEVLKGKSPREASFILEAQPEISKVEIKFRPFPLPKISSNVEKIKLILVLS